MIINTEIRDLTQYGKPVFNSNGQCKRFLCVSYVDSDKQIKYYTCIIPDEWMYQWKYAKRNETPDSVFKSWDFKNVIKQPITGKFSEQRVHEMLLDLKRMYPDNYAISKFDELYIPDTWFSDIEVNVGDDGFPDAISARNPINTISLVNNDKVYVLGLAPLSNNDIEWISNEIKKHCEKFDTDYKFEYRFHNTEQSLLNDFFFNFFVNMQCITGWNWFGYDWPYLTHRAEKLGIELNGDGITTPNLSPTKTWYKYKPQGATTDSEMVDIPTHKCMYDYMEIYKKWDKSVSPKVSNKLDWVSEKVLGVKKVVHQLGFKEMWERQKKEYVFYNAIDSILVREIDKKLKTSSAFFGLANIMHTPALTAFTSTKSIEIVQAEYLYKENRIFPTVKKDMEDSDGYEGAFVFEPKPNIYRNVFTLDYASLYPTTQRQFNISPDTYLFKDKNYTPKPNEIKTSSGAVYTKEFEGFIPKILTDFYGKRKSFKKEMQIAEKEMDELIEIYKKRTGKNFV